VTRVYKCTIRAGPGQAGPPKQSTWPTMIWASRGNAQLPTTGPHVPVAPHVVTGLPDVPVRQLAWHGLPASTLLQPDVGQSLLASGGGRSPRIHTTTTDGRKHYLSAELPSTAHDMTVFPCDIHANNTQSGRLVTQSTLPKVDRWQLTWCGAAADNCAPNTRCHTSGNGTS
jgi:hypothetical protein